MKVLKKNYLFLLLLLSFINPLYLVSEDEVETTPEPEEEKEYIKDIVEDFTKYEGFFETYQDPETSDVYLVVAEDQLEEEFIYFAHVLNGVVAAEFKGLHLDNGIFKIEKHFDTLRLVRVNTAYTYDNTLNISKSSGTNISDATLKVLPIKASDADEKQHLVDITDLLTSEDLTPIKPIPYPSSYPGSDNEFRWGAISREKTKINDVYNYPGNTDFEVEYVLESAPSYAYDSPDAADPRYINISVRYSFIGMPKNNFEPRLANQSIGYFEERITDLSSKEANPYADLIHKWDLQKKYPDQEVSEPIIPIKFWIENTTPENLRSLISEGVLAWNKAFLRAGFKNAVEVEVQPDDAKWDAGDINYNVLRWTSSPDAPFGGYGPSFVNPRTGQIIGADIMLEWVYVTNRINLDAIFNKSHMDCSFSYGMHESNLLANLSTSSEEHPELLRQSIIRLTLHEVGHTLGLNHNFKGSYLNSNADIHNKAITQDRGLTNSVMEYPAVNIAPLGIQQGDYYDTQPGLYDDWAIEFGYKPNLSKNDMDKLLSKSDMPELMFANDSEDMRSVGNGIDPRAMIYDLTNEPITYGEQRIELVNHIISELPERLDNKVDSWEEYRNAYSLLLRETEKALIIASRHIGGVHVNRSTPQQESSLKPYEPVPYDIQKQAMSMLSKHAFSPEAFPINKDLLSIVQVQRRGFDLRGEGEDPKLLKGILSIQNDILRQLLHPNVLERITNSTLYGNSYSVNELIADLNQSVFFSDINSEVSYARQNLQITYVKKLLKIVNNNLHDEISISTAYSALRDIEKIMKKSSRDEATKSHRLYVRWLIDSELTKL